jgi:hypothetical protein
VVTELQVARDEPGSREVHTYAKRAGQLITRMQICQIPQRDFPGMYVILCNANQSDILSRAAIARGTDFGDGEVNIVCVEHHVARRCVRKRGDGRLRAQRLEDVHHGRKA